MILISSSLDVYVLIIVIYIAGCYKYSNISVFYVACCTFSATTDFVLLATANCTCDSSGDIVKCLADASICDSFVNCGAGEDETNCTSLSFAVQTCYK